MRLSDKPTCCRWALAATLSLTGIALSGCSSVRPLQDSAGPGRPWTGGAVVQPLPGTAEGDGSLRFEPNLGRWDENVLFVATSSTERVIVHRTGLETVAPPPKATRALLRFQGSTGPLQASAERPLPGVTNYYLGRNPSRWYRNVPAYARVWLRRVYPGIDVLLSGMKGELQIAVVAAHAENLSGFHLALDGNEFVTGTDGRMLAHVGGSELCLGSLTGFSKREDGWREECVEYEVHGSVSLRQLGEYPSAPAVVDPTLTWSASMQGKETDRATSVAAAPDGGFYVAGWTNEAGFPGTAVDEWGGLQAFVARFAADTSLQWVTILNGAEATGIAASGTGVWVAGWTSSTAFPVLHPYQPSLAGPSDAFVARLSPGGQLSYGTYLGGSGSDRATGLAVLGDGSPVVGGVTCSQDFPTTPGAMASRVGGDAACDEQVTRDSDGFVAALSADGQSLKWATYLGGKNTDGVTSVAATPNGDIIAAGWTWSPDFPLKGALFAELSGTGRDGDPPDGFVSQFDGATGGLVASTFLGGLGYDEVDAVTVSKDGSIIVGGSTSSCDFPVTAGAYDTQCGSGAETWNAGWIAVLSDQLSHVIAATYGGGHSEGGAGGVPNQVSALAVDSTGRIWAGGISFATAFPAVAAFQPFMVSYHDATIQAFNPSLDHLLFSTLLGGVEAPFDLPTEQFRSIAALSSGQVVVAGGSGASATFPRTTILGVPDDIQRLEHAIVCTVDPDHGGTDLKVTLDGPQSLLENQSGEFTAIVANIGSGVALDPEVLVDYLGSVEGFSSDDSTVECRQMEFLYGCKRPSLAPGESFTIHFSYLPYWEAGEGILLAAVRSRVSELVPSNVEVVATPGIVSAADLGVGIIDTPPNHPAPNPGEIFCYWVSVNNEGHAAADNTLLRLPVPTGGHFLMWSPTVGQCALVDGDLECQLGTIKSMDGATVEVYLELPLQGPVDITAEVTTTSPEGYLANNVAHDVVDLASAVTPYHVGVAGIAHNHGATGTVWRSDLEVVNPYETATDVELDLVTQSGTQHRSVTIPPGALSRWNDVEVDLFGLDRASEASGAIHVWADRRVAVGARSYNSTPSGTYGQYMPAIEEPTSPRSLQGTVPWLKRDANFRTNLGFLNLGSQACSGTVVVSDNKGKDVFERPIAIPALGWVQLFNILAGAAGAPTLATASLVAPSDCAVWSYASMVDGRTGDPTTIPPFTFPEHPAYIGAFAHRPGVAGTVWRTDVALDRPTWSSGDPPVTLQFIQSADTIMATVPLPNGPLAEWQNAPESIFRLAPSTQAAGTLMGWNTGGSLIVRTYNETPNGTYGQSFDSEQTYRDALHPPQLGLLPFIEENNQARTNVGFVTVQPDNPATVRLTLFDSSGKQVGEPQVFTVGTWTANYATGMAMPLNGGPWLQIDHVVTKFGVTSLDQGYLRVEVPSGDWVWAYASVVDQRTGDPMTVPVWTLNLPGIP